MKSRKQAGPCNLEDSPPAIESARPCCPVQLPISGLYECRTRFAAISAVCRGAKAVKRGQHPAWGDFEDRAATRVHTSGDVGPATNGSPIKVPVATLNQPPLIRVEAVGAITQCAEAVDRCESAGGGDLEDRSTLAMRPEISCCPIKIPVLALNQTGDRGGSISAVKTLRAKVVKSGQYT